jgi:O-antigen ligase
MVLRPVAVLLLGYGLIGLGRQDLRAHRATLIGAALIVALPALQLLPLPPALWQQLPDRGLIAEALHLAGLGDPWRPLTMAPTATGNALAACAVPLAALVIGLRVSSEERVLLLPVVLLLSGVSALVGLLQVVGDGDTSLYPSPITNLGSAVGLFANRNHQGTLLAAAVPMLAIAALSARAGWRLGAVAAGILILPLILITGSRSGLILAVLGLAAIPLVLRGLEPIASRPPARKPASPRPLAWGGTALAGAGLLLIVLTAWVGRGEAWSRLIASGGLDQRLQLLPTLLPLILRYLPFGTGFGSFERVFQIHEPDSLLGPAVVNHAHDDLLQVLLEGGVPAALLLLAGVVVYVRAVRRAWSAAPIPPQLLACARLGLVIIALETAASTVDYPLRTPVHAALFVVALLWAQGLAYVKTESKLLDRNANGNHPAEAGPGV